MTDANIITIQGEEGEGERRGSQCEDTTSEVDSEEGAKRQRIKCEVRPRHTGHECVSLLAIGVNPVPCGKQRACGREPGRVEPKREYASSNILHT